MLNASGAPAWTRSDTRDVPAEAKSEPPRDTSVERKWNTQNTQVRSNDQPRCHAEGRERRPGVPKKIVRLSIYR